MTVHPAIFISHASADVILADGLFQLLQTGCNVPTGGIYCTSIDGSGIATGEQFVEHIKAGLLGADLVILLVTPMYFDRAFCVAEMGAAWGLGKEVFPLVVAGMPRDLGANMLGRQTQVLDERGLDFLRDAVRRIRSEWEVATPRWNVMRDLALSSLRPVVAGLTQPESVPRAEVAAAQAERAEVLALLKDAHVRESELLSLVEELKAAKDATAVRAITARHSTAEQQYEALREALADALATMNRAEVRVLFAVAQKESSWTPGDVDAVDWVDVSAAVNRRTLEAHEGSASTAYATNPQHPRMRSALAALNALEEFLGTEAANEVIIRIEEQEEILAAIDSSEFWLSELVSDARPMWP